MSVYDVVAYGADPTGNIDSTLTIQAAVNAAKAANADGATVYFPPGKYSVSSINVTGWNGARLEAGGGPSSVTILGNRQTTPAPILDFTGSSAVIVDAIVAGGMNISGTIPTVVPLAGFLFGQTTALGDSNKNRMNDCGSVGYFESAPLCVIGSTDNAFYSCAFQQWRLDRPVLNLSVNPDWYIRSLFKTLSPVASNVGDTSFFACEFHGAGNSASTCWTIYCRNADNLRFFGGNCDNSGPAHMLFQGSNARRVLIAGLKFYSESGHAADYLIHNDVPLDGAALVCNEADNAYSAGRFTGGGIRTGFQWI